MYLPIHCSLDENKDRSVLIEYICELVQNVESLPNKVRDFSLGMSQCSWADLEKMMLDCPSISKYLRCLSVSGCWDWKNLRFLREMQALRKFTLYGDVPDSEALFRILPNLAQIEFIMNTYENELIVSYRVSSKIIRLYDFQIFRIYEFELIFSLNYRPGKCDSETTFSISMDIDRFGVKVGIKCIFGNPIFGMVLVDIYL